MKNVDSLVLSEIREFFHRQRQADRAVLIGVRVHNNQGLIVAYDKNDGDVAPLELANAFGSRRVYSTAAHPHLDSFVQEAIDESKSETLDMPTQDKYEFIAKQIAEKISTLDIQRD